MLAVIPVRDGVLPAGGAETAAECGGRSLVVGSAAEIAARELGGSVTVIELGQFAVGAWAAAIAAQVRTERVIVLPGSPDGRDLAPRLAATLGWPLFAGAVSASSESVVVARRGGSQMHAFAPRGAFVATLQPGVRGAEELGPVTIAESVPTAATNGIDAPVDADVIAVLPPDAATMDLAEAPRILGGGAGLDSPERFAALADVAASLGASVGATRVITDRGWIGHERQIGTTGVVVDPRLYVAFGISGAVQHTSGLGTPEHIISVNVDQYCPMMQLADLAIVSDANAVLEELHAMLGARVA